MPNVVHLGPVKLFTGLCLQLDELQTGSAIISTELFLIVSFKFNRLDFVWGFDKKL